MPEAERRQENLKGQELVRVLIVEDDPEDVDLIHDLIEEAEGGAFHVERAKRLSEAMEKLTSVGADVVLLDLGLPDSTGLYSLGILREAFPKVPIVILTGLEDEATAVKAVRRGAEDFLVKSHVDGELLVRAIRYAIERRKTRREIELLNMDLERRVKERTSELALARDALASAHEELLQLDRMKSNFIDVTSHELVTPVVTIGGMLQLIKRQHVNERDGQDGALDAAIHASQRLERLVSRIIKMEKAGNFREPINREPADMRTLLRNAVDYVWPFTASRNLKVALSVSDSTCPVMIDVEMMQDVVLNLLMNAIRFTPDGGEITVGVKRLADAIEISVSDTGIGIPEEERGHIFEDFFTGFDTLHRTPGEFRFGSRGIGLGLSTARRFIEMHGGKIRFASEMNKGTTFTFTLPLAEEMAKESAPPAAK